MKRALGFAALAGAGVLAATALAAGSQPPAGTGTVTNPAVQAAGHTCKAQGLTPGTDAFKQCVQQIVKGSKTNTNPASTNPAVQAAGKTCQGQGLTPGTDAFKQCVRQIVKPGGGKKPGSTTTTTP